MSLLQPHDDVAPRWPASAARAVDPGEPCRCRWDHAPEAGHIRTSTHPACPYHGTSSTEGAS